MSSIDEVNNMMRVATLEEIAALPPNTEEVFVSHLDDRKVDALAGLKRLRRLLQDGNSFVTDEGLEIIGTMLSLEELDLEWSENITDAGLVHLYGLNRLKWLDVGFCRKLTEQGVASLKLKLPECEIVWERLR